MIKKGNSGTNWNPNISNPIKSVNNSKAEN